MEFLVITGMSGAGKSQTLRAMEDMGYYGMDNLPPALLPKFAELLAESKKPINKVAIVVDIRGREFFHNLFKALDDLANMNIGYKILYLDASDKTLIKRYKELRRPHPLEPEGSIIDGIAEERKLMQELKEKSSYIIDTSRFTIGMLKNELHKIFTKDGEKRRITILITSFGFKNGMLLDGDLIFDVRFLPNPYYIPELKEVSGENQETIDYVFKWNQTNTFISKTVDLLEFLIPYYIEEGKTQLVVGIGCTGGFHRSVAIANEIASILNTDGHRAMTNHRDLRRR